MRTTTTLAGKPALGQISTPTWAIAERPHLQQVSQGPAETLL